MWRGGRDGETDQDFYLLQDNAPCHTGTLSLAKLGECNVDLLNHPPYSPDLAPADYFLFPLLKETLRGRQFANIPELQAEVFRLLRRIEPDKFLTAIQDLPRRWLKCIRNAGEYFEGCGLDVEQEYQALDIVFAEESESEESEDTDKWLW